MRRDDAESRTLHGPPIMAANTPDGSSFATGRFAGLRRHETATHLRVGRGHPRELALDMTQNMPMELYENDVLYAVEYGPQESKCVRESHPGWRLYRAQGRTEITFVPVP